ncbi:MAG: chloride channel protein [Phoenicibacter congonensis]|uniref:Chloride channel protein n=1 Tax=Phoenicibacter congonensis TaxID=1944646 RepID=A0AA43RJ82_9ACTN|nr:chloride channel protein [Phoenicibacter congonensis]
MGSFKNIVRISAASVAIGLVVGLIVSIFSLALTWCNSFRIAHEHLIFLLPVGGFLIVLIHQLAGVKNPTGTNRVIQRMHERTYVRWIMAPLIFASTLISQFFGASVGREAAALQIGGSVGSEIGKLFKVAEHESPVIIITGMSAAFSALFGTPITAVIFALELEKGRISSAHAILPAVVSSMIARLIAGALNVSFLVANIGSPLDFTAENFLLVFVLGLCCAVLSVAFSQCTRLMKFLFAKFSDSKYVQVFMCAFLVIVLTLLVGEQTYNGVGSDTILKCITDSTFKVAWWACIFKIVFTAVSLGGGFQGGEIIPALFIGATFGSFFGSAFGISPTVCAALGMVGLMAGTTKCGFASLAMAFELFGIVCPEYFLLIVPIALFASGPFRIYEKQDLWFARRNNHRPHFTKP